MNKSIHILSTRHACALAITGALAVGTIAVSGCSDSDGDSANVKVQLASSSGTNLSSGGDALVKVVGAPSDATVTVTLNGRDISPQFSADISGAARFALVTGLLDGENTILASIPGSTGEPGKLTFKNYPITGPIFSGPQQKPFYCETTSFRLAVGGTLGDPIDANCSVKTRVDYAYRTTSDIAPAFRPLTNLAKLPSDVAMTTTTDGRTVNYVVRIETGTVNRGVYEIAILHDPTKENEPSIRNAAIGWNRKLINIYGGGCAPGWYRQGPNTAGVMVDELLRQGYALSSSTLNVFANNCNETLAAETTLMVKERFIKRYGEPVFVMGAGESASTYQMHQAINIYPGILDGIISAGSFPDSMSNEQSDAAVLDRYWKTTAPGTFTQEQQRSVFGFLDYAALANRSAVAIRFNPGSQFAAVVPNEIRYNPVTNPTGSRGTLSDANINIYGRDPGTGFANRVVDNVGLQYGIEPLNSGIITKQQFLDLNERVGGFDIDFNFTVGRTTASEAAVKLLHERGRLLDASFGIGSTPIIDYRAYADTPGRGDQHVRMHTFATRERLIKANGDAGNQVIFTEDYRYGLFSWKSPVVLEAVAQMDEWLKRLKADQTNDAQRTKVLRAKPSNLTDTCWSPDSTPIRVEEPASYNGAGRCNGWFPAGKNARIVAGAPLSNNVLKCQLKPIDAMDYKVTFSADELARLRRIFSSGVCDFSRLGVGQVHMTGQWLSFGAP